MFEEQQGGDRHHTVAGRGLRVVVHVQLHDLEVLALSGQLLEMGSDDPTRSAPCRPEVNEHRLVGLEHLGLEVLIGDLVDSACHGCSLSVWRRVVSTEVESLYKI